MILVDEKSKTFAGPLEQRYGIRVSSLLETPVGGHFYVPLIPMGENIMAKTTITVLKKALCRTGAVYALLFLGFALFFSSSFLPMHHMTAIRLFRGALFLFVILVLYQFFSIPSPLPPEAFRTRTRLSVLLTAMWGIPYLWIFSRNPRFFQDDCGYYFIFAPFLFAFLLCVLSILSVIRNSLIKRLGQGILFLYVCFYLFSSLASAFYFFSYGQTIDEYALLCVIATTPQEAWNYLSSFPLALK
ncbi:MAG: hypothetical protein LKE33_04925 [Acidaminococcus sp.]|jgi:heptose-I-phosphate ethanolaminephosphotransferase|nr:hypothetical protein [Acidaminococcus sp.]MCI2100028.1 hypothetical protein [Acidaminococcus sp.]MCI2114292.1 hypothetical protein [Acidaminococcus sp.]MCI2116901.1 hypothetical protein [Acidaminococcus sp.]